jgi:hypothetical protein
MWIVELYPLDGDQWADFYGPFADEEAASQFLVASDREGETCLVRPPPMLTTSDKKA